jgi:hypothetical protein
VANQLRTSGTDSSANDDLNHRRLV